MILDAVGSYDACMHIASPPLGPDQLPTTIAPPPGSQPPLRWARWWTSPIARVDYGRDSVLAPWHEARIPTERSLTGARRPSLAYGGRSQVEAEAAARLLAQVPVEVTLRIRGRARTVSLHPAIAVLRDARAGAFWLAPLHTTVRSGAEWIEIPHTIDGAAFAGRWPLLRTPHVSSATQEMVSVVGRETVLKPSAWRDAPRDSIVTP